MLSDVFLTVISTLLSILVSAVTGFTNFPLSTTVEQAITFLGRLDPVLPVHELTICLSLMIGFVVAFFGFKWVKQIIDWVIDVIP